MFTRWKRRTETLDWWGKYVSFLKDQTQDKNPVCTQGNLAEEQVEVHSEIPSVKNIPGLPTFSLTLLFAVIFLFLAFIIYRLVVRVMILEEALERLNWRLKELEKSQ